jgi:putative transposase
VLAGAQEKLERKYRLAAGGYTLDRLIDRVAELLVISTEEVMGPGKARQRVEARSVLCCGATTELGISQTQLAQRLPLNQPAVSNAVRRGERFVGQQEYTIEA